MEKEEEIKVLSKIQRQCVRREYCESDIYRKLLKRLEGDGEAAGRLLESLVKDKFVDNRRYAFAYAREKSVLNGWGPMKIRHMLRTKRVGERDIEDALNDVDRDEAVKKCEKVLERKYATISGEADCKSKMLRYACGRGYSRDAALPIIDRLISSKKDDR